MPEIKEEKDVKQWCQQYNTGTAGLVMPLDIKHSYANWQYITQEFVDGRAKDMQVLADKCRGPALLFGSGPSMDDLMPMIHDFKGSVCCSTSQATTLLYYGKSPDLIVQLDAQTRLDELIAPTWSKNTILCLNPGCHPDIVQAWKGPKLYYRPIDPSREFYNMILPMAYPQITTQLLLFSCSPAAQLGILRNLGYNPIFLVGLDMGFPKNKSRFTWWHWREFGAEIHNGKYKTGGWRWIPDPPTAMPEEFIRSKNGVLTDRTNLFFKRSIFAVTLLETHRPEAPQVIYASKGIFTEFPIVDGREVIAKQGQGFEKLYRTAEETRNVCERYLATQSMYVVEFDAGGGQKGVRFIECEDWKTTVPGYIAEMIKQGLKVEDANTAMSRISQIVKGNEEAEKGA